MNLYRYVGNRVATSIDPSGKITSAKLGLPKIDGTTTLVVGTDPRECCILLYVDGVYRGARLNLGRHSVSFPFDYDWLKRRAGTPTTSGSITLKTNRGQYTTDYFGEKYTWNAGKFAIDYALLENLGLYAAEADVTGVYTKYWIFGFGPWDRTVGGSVWDKTIGIAGGWLYNSEADTGEGYIFDATSPFGSSGRRSDNEEEDYSRGPSIGADPHPELQKMDKHVNAELYYASPKDKWFVEGAPFDVLRFKMGLVITAGAGSGLSNTTVEVDLPGHVLQDGQED